MLDKIGVNVKLLAVDMRFVKIVDHLVYYMQSNLER